MILTFIFEETAILIPELTQKRRSGRRTSIESSVADDVTLCEMQVPACVCRFGALSDKATAFL